jgi:hypothetical protein
MSEFIKGFLLVGEVEPFLEWVTKTGGSWREGKGMWQMAQVRVTVREGSVAQLNYHPITRDKHNLISISDETKQLVQKWKTESLHPYTDARMLDWLIESRATMRYDEHAGEMLYSLYWAEEDEVQADWYKSAREAIMAQMRAEGQ